MIADKDRSGWFGASDTDKILSKFDGKCFCDWWMTKIGITRNTFESDAMNAGTFWEGRIIDSLGFPVERNKQILLPEFRLRINLDANTEFEIFEVKTHKMDKPFVVPLKYKRQVWVQKFGSEIPKINIVSYGLTENDYQNYLAKFDMSRRKIEAIEYDSDFINKKYLPRLKYLVECLTNGTFPTEEGALKWLI